MKVDSGLSGLGALMSGFGALAAGHSEVKKIQPCLEIEGDKILIYNLGIKKITVNVVLLL